MARRTLRGRRPRSARGVLVAVGGYGRAELSPRSDLDLLLLHDGSDPGTVSKLADRLWYPVWDLGIALDHSVRTPAEARKTAGEDLKVQLGLLDARHIAGDLGLTTALRTTVLADWRNQAPKRLPALRELCEERAARQGELQYLLEPDLKEAHGGLRDATALRAVAASWLADAPAKDSPRPAAASSTYATPCIWPPDAPPTGSPSRNRTRSPPNSASSTPTPCSARSTRPPGSSPTPATSPGARSAASCAPARCGPGYVPCWAAASPRPSGPRSPKGSWSRTAKWCSPAPRAPTATPCSPPRRAAAAQAGLPLNLHAVRRMAAGARALPSPWPAEARQQLITLLGSGRPTVDVWEALEAEGLISLLLPDWDRVRCRPQRNAVHLWTVDRHLIETAVRASAFTRRVSRPDLLLVAALLHDIGKGWPGDHSVAGEVIARDVAARIGFDAGDVTVVATLVRHHLLLVETATRRDLDDPATVRSVAEAVGSPGTLELLHALTEADALATGAAAWSSWRASLVADLVKRVAAVLAGQAPPDPEEAAPTAQHERLALEAAATGAPVLSLRAQTEPPAEPSDDPEPLGVELLIAVPDQAGVLPAVAGVLAVHRLTVRTAELRSLDLPDGVDGSVLLLDWRVAAEYGSLPQAARLRADLVRALDGSLDISGRLAERDAAYPRRRGVVAPPPRVTVAPAASRHATVIEVRAQDAPGLLFRIGRALEDAGVNVRSAHAGTLGANAVDAFYVTGGEGLPLPDEEAVSVARKLEETLRA